MQNEKNIFRYWKVIGCNLQPIQMLREEEGEGGGGDSRLDSKYSIWYSVQC